MTSRLALWLALCCGSFALAPLVATPGLAQTGGATDTIQAVRVEGAQRIEPTTIASYLTVRPGDTFDPVALDASLKSLFASGLFADVSLQREGGTLVVQVTENPIINQIAFEGNSIIKDDVLENEVQLRPRVVYTRTRVQNDVARLLEVYRRSGRFAATVEPKIIQLDQNRVDLVFEINEGPATGIERINFVGNQAFSDSRLRDEIETAESHWYDILTSSDNYDPDRVNVDKELLRRFYLTQGYADFRVISAVAELTPDGEGFYLTFTVDEGQRYRFGKLDVTSQLPDIDINSLRQQIVAEEGDWYSSQLVEDSVRNLQDAIGRQQYAFAEVNPLINRNREAGTIDITFAIGEGDRVFVERIDITGNDRTVDRVIRREMELVEGDPFNTEKLRQSEGRIRDLGFFKSVEVNAVPGSSPDRTVIQVNVQEQSTGELAIGAGFSTTEGPLGNISLRERNLLGRAQDLRLSATLSGARQQIDFSFTEPHFLDRNLSAGIDIFNIKRDNQDESAYDESLIGGALRFGFPLSENLTQTVRLRFENRKVENIPDDASDYIKEQEGSSVSTTLNQQIVYDQLDSRLEPTEGYTLRFGTEIAGLVGDVAYFQTTAGANAYVPLDRDRQWILSFSAEGGYIVGLGQDVGINDRFFVGGTNLRGFEAAGIGPRDGNGDALGGNLYGVGSVELTFPLGLPQDYGLKGRAFTDIGWLGVSDVDPINNANPANVIDDEDSVRWSAGVGLSWRSPFGPVRIDYAVPILAEDFDKLENFRFSFGTRF